MTPDEPAPGALPSQASSHALPSSDEGSASRGRSTVTVIAVASAAVGLLALAGILLTALLGRDVWPGLVLATYVCLPLSFLLMVSLVVGSFISRRRT